MTVPTSEVPPRFQATSKERRANRLSSDAALELRLNAAGEVLAVHGDPLIDRARHVIVDPRWGRRQDDGAGRVGLRVVLDDGRSLWLGEACGALAEGLEQAQEMLMARVAGESIVGVRVLPVAAVAGDQEFGTPPREVDALAVARHFESGAVAVALTTQPGNPGPELFRLVVARRIARMPAARAS
jgi:hypothetical protein